MDQGDKGKTWLLDVIGLYPYFFPIWWKCLFPVGTSKGACTWIFSQWHECIFLIKRVPQRYCKPWQPHINPTPPCVNVFQPRQTSNQQFFGWITQGALMWHCQTQETYSHLPSILTQSCHVSGFFVLTFDVPNQFQLLASWFDIAFCVEAFPTGVPQS